MMKMLNIPLFADQTPDLLKFPDRRMESTCAVQGTVRKIDIFFADTGLVKLQERKPVQLYHDIRYRKDLLHLFQKVQVCPQQLGRTWCQPSLGTQTVVEPCLGIDDILDR